MHKKIRNTIEKSINEQRIMETVDNKRDQYIA